MEDNENPQPKKNSVLYLFALGYFIFAVFVLSVSDMFGSSAETVTSGENNSYRMDVAPQPQIDLMTKYSCRDWQQVIGAGAKENNTEAEIRAGLAKVYNLARFSEDTDIVESATRQLATITAGDLDGFALASKHFGNACRKYGAL